MIHRTIETYPTYKIFVTALKNQTFITATVTASDEDGRATADGMYSRLAQILNESSSQIIHERCFADVGFQQEIMAIRNRELRSYGIDPDTPMTFVEGKSCIENAFSGVQIRALKPLADTEIRTILDKGYPRGRMWNLNGSTFYILQGIDGGLAAGEERTNRKSRSEAMFHQAENLLRAQGADYKDVLRTWIYISDILEWYDDFNEVRNRCYSDFGFLNESRPQSNTEQLYLPASTGIEGRNPKGLPAVMDVFAVHSSKESSIKIRSIYGTKQRSAYRYGSAFSRAVVVEESGSKLILVSGTASIDDEGKSIFLGDAASQIRQTLSVVRSLVEPEGATLQDLCEATVFLKNPADYPTYQRIMEESGMADMPTVHVIADVCRKELLFELDAAFILGTTTA